MSTEKKPSRVRLIAFLALLAIWIIGGITQAVLWNQLVENRTAQVMSVWIIAPTVVFFTLVWWTFFSGFRVVTRLAGWGVLILAVAAFAAKYRFEGFDGDFVPRFADRSEPTAEEKFLAARQAEADYDGEPPAIEMTDEPLSVEPDDWPRFRGPKGDGVVADARIPRNWDSPPRVIWEKRVGPGWSSFTVVNNLVFTQMQIGEDESIVCFDLETGTEVWAHKDEGVRFEEERAGVGPMATPTFYRGRLYAVGAKGDLNCLNPKTGEEYWSANILKDANSKNITWGMAGSPVGYEDMILVNPGSNDDEQTAVAAYHWKTGEKLWSGGDNQAGYSTPVVATLDGTKQILMFDGEGLTGHSLDDGSELWHFPWPTDFQINVAQPIVREDGAIFISASYNMGSALVRAAKDGDGKWGAALADWETNKRFKLKFGDAVLKDGKIYGLSETILMCLDFQSGDILWKQRGDFGYGQMVLVDDVLVILTDEGEVVFVEASEEHPELFRFQAIEGKTWGHPVFVRGLLLVRNGEFMACYDLRPENTDSAKEAAPPTNEPEEK